MLCAVAHGRKGTAVAILSLMESHSADLLARGLDALDLPSQGPMFDALLRYIAEIELWNPLYGLVHASGNDLVIKHILDSVTPWKLIDQELRSCDAALEAAARIDTAIDTALDTTMCPTMDTMPRASLADLGTGAGLPGIPLALALPERTVRLADRMGKRITFVETMRAILPLKNSHVEECAIERIAGPLHVCVFRAFRPFSETALFRALWSRIVPGSALVAYKGRLEHARAEIAAMRDDPVLGAAASRAEISPLCVPFLDDERCLVFLRKPAPGAG